MIPKTMEELMEQFYGPSKLVRKAGIYTPGTYTAGTFWEPLWGKKVWSWLNMEVNIFAIIPKEPWIKSGWRVLTTKAHSTGGGIDTDASGGGAVPGAQSLTFEQIHTQPKTMAHTFDIGEDVAFLSSVDDAVELLPYYREEIGKEHVFCINYQSGLDGNTQAGDNIESIDRIIASTSEDVGSGYDANDYDLYYTRGTALDRDSTSTYDAYVSHNSTTDRDLTLVLIDTVLQNVWDNGGLPKVILTKNNTLMRWQQLLEAERRFVDTARVVPTFGGVRGPAPGVEGGFMVATYFGIPIIPSQHTATDTIGRIYFIDTDYLKFGVAQPTTYAETGKGADFLHRSKLTFKGMYKTIGEYKAYRFNCHGKLRELQ